MSLVGLALGSVVKARARELGFDRVAIGPAEPPEHGDALEAWLDAGYAGTMSYLDRGRADRLDPARLLPGARSVVAVAMSYNPGSSTESQDDWRPVSRYARGRDYHDVIRPRLVELGEFIGSASGARVASRAAVDSSAVLERDLAARAGLGWVGKNTNLLTPSLGSYFFIGIVLTTAVLPFDQREPDRCGTCSACLDACPTRAFVAPGVFGELETLLGLDPVEFRARFRGSALTRTKRAGLLRNAAIVLANRGERRAVGALNRALGDEDAVVRRAAAWALAKLGDNGEASS